MLTVFLSDQSQEAIVNTKKHKLSAEIHVSGWGGVAAVKSDKRDRICNCICMYNHRLESSSVSPGVCGHFLSEMSGRINQPVEGRVTTNYIARVHSHREDTGSSTTCLRVIIMFRKKRKKTYLVSSTTIGIPLGR